MRKYCYCLTVQGSNWFREVKQLAHMLKLCAGHRRYKVTGLTKCYLHEACIYWGNLVLKQINNFTYDYRKTKTK